MKQLSILKCGRQRSCYTPSFKASFNRVPRNSFLSKSIFQFYICLQAKNYFVFPCGKSWENKQLGNVYFSSFLVSYSLRCILPLVFIFINICHSEEILTEKKPSSNLYWVSRHDSPAHSRSQLGPLGLWQAVSHHTGS